MPKRPSNYPREEILLAAARTIRANGGPDLVRVFYKWDCFACGSREIHLEPNELPQIGTCSVCHQQTTILGAGFMMQHRATKSTPWDTGNVMVIRKQYDSDRGDA